MNVYICNKCGNRLNSSEKPTDQCTNCWDVDWSLEDPKVMLNFKERAEKRKQEYYSHVSPEMKALAERAEPITLDEWNNLRSNSYERKLLYKNLSNEALIHLSNYCIDQAGGRLTDMMIASDYNESVIRELAPLLADRLSIAENDKFGFEKLNVKEGDILLLKADAEEMPDHDYEEMFKVLPDNVNIFALSNSMSFEVMSSKEIDDMLCLLTKQKSDIAKRLKEILIRNVGDNRDCPACRKSVIISDQLSKKTYQLYTELFSQEKKDG